MPLLSMPSMSGGALRHSISDTVSSTPNRFYALDVGRGFATTGSGERSAGSTFLCPRCRAGLCDNRFWRAVGWVNVSMPSMSGGALRRRILPLEPAATVRFYALDVGRGFATQHLRHREQYAQPFLCPRCRAGLCDNRFWRAVGWVNVSMPSMSGGALRRRILPLEPAATVRFYALDVGRGFATQHLRHREQYAQPF